MAKVLVLDDDADFRSGVLETLGDLGHAAVGTARAGEAMAALTRETFDLVLLDFKMPGSTGVEVLAEMRAQLGERTPPTVMITAFSDSQNTIEAMRLGALDHLTKPVSKADLARIVGEAVRAEHPAVPTAVGGDALVGQGERMREVLKMVGRLAANDATVLITGETGTGKEVIAQAIHRNGARAGGPFVALNCAAVPENLLESELFGHVRGAFTGATCDRRGSFQLAQGGTLFLDEIGDMPLALQAKMLRAVQEREVTPLGAARPIKIDCRILAATHRDLRALVARQEFREDLYYRLNVVELHLPPLRDRPEDLETLAQRFAARASLGPAALAKLRAHTWPGNIRELKNVIARALVIARGSRLDADDIRLLEPAGAPPPGEDDLDWHAAIARLERRLLARALTDAGGNRSEAARRLGIQRQLLYAKMKEHGVAGDA